MKTINKLALITAFLFTSVALSFSQGSISGYLLEDITGEIINDNGVPIQLVNSQTGMSVFASIENGYYEFTNLPSGEYALIYSVFDSPHKWVDNDETDPLDNKEVTDSNFSLDVSFISVVLSEGENEIRNDLVLPQPSSISGYVYINDNGSEVPVSGISISLVNQETLDSRTVTTNEDGYYQFNVDPGSYEIITYEYEYNAIDNDESNPLDDHETIGGYYIPVEVQLSEIEVRNDFFKSVQGSISGYATRVVDGVVVPYANAQILLEGYSNDGVIIDDSIITDENGFYIFDNLSTGNYTVMLEGTLDANITAIDNNESDPLDNKESVLSYPTSLQVSLQLDEQELRNDFRLLGTLPVEFLSQSASLNNNSVLVEWSTLTEVNNDRFEIERSLDGLSFEKIGEVKGSGTTSQVKEYSFTDKNPSQSGVVYYRIKQIDYDGKFDYSDVFNINFIGYLNPYLSGEIIIVDGLSQSVNYELVSLNGQIVKQGIVSRTVDVSDINAGLYILRLTENNRLISVSKIVK